VLLILNDSYIQFMILICRANHPRPPRLYGAEVTFIIPLFDLRMNYGIDFKFYQNRWKNKDSTTTGRGCPRKHARAVREHEIVEWNMLLDREHSLCY
jgi:hypothetical protein